MSDIVSKSFRVDPAAPLDHLPDPPGHCPEPR